MNTGTRSKILVGHENHLIVLGVWAAGSSGPEVSIWQCLCTHQLGAEFPFEELFVARGEVGFPQVAPGLRHEETQRVLHHVVNYRPDREIRRESDIVLGKRRQDLYSNYILKFPVLSLFFPCLTANFPCAHLHDL